MEYVIVVTRQRYHLVVISKIDEADRALTAEFGCILLLSNFLKVPLLGFSKCCLKFEESLAHGDWVDAKVN